MNKGWARLGRSAHAADEAGGAFAFRTTMAASLVIVGLLPLSLAWGVWWFAVPALAPHQRGLSAAVAYAGLAGLVFAMAAAVSRRLVRPLRALGEGARRIGEGDLDYRVDLPGRSDYARVAAAFNTMAGRLAESHRTLEQTVADRTMALTAVHTVSLTANRSLDPDEILSSVLDRLPVVLNLEAGFIRLASEQGLPLRAHRGVPSRFVETAAVCRWGEGLSGRAAETGGPVVSEGPDETSEGVLFHEGFRAALCVPITAKGHVLGTLAVASRYPRTFTSQDLQLLTSIGSQLGTALENAGLYERACAMAEEFQQLDRLKTEFLSNVSHELRIPLTSVIGFADLLLERIPGDLNPEQDRYLRTMLESGRYLLDMINNLLDLSKIKAGKAEWRPITFELRPVIETVERTIRPIVVKKHLHLVVDVAEGPAVVFADQGRVKQILLNLVSNAVKFTPAGGTVRVQVRRVDGLDGAGVELKVEDTGIGIAADDLERIFNEFHQVDGSPTRDYHGTGLGLSITKRLIELQGGRIDVESRLGEGSRFTVWLPRGEAPAAADPPTPPSGIMQSVMESLISAAATRTLDSRKSPRIAVVVADARLRDSVCQSLETEGYEVHGLEPDERLITCIRSLRPFAVIVECASGFESWMTVRELRAVPDVHPILLAPDADGLRAASLPAVGYVVTPVAPDALRAALRRYGLLRAVRRRPATLLAVAPPDTVSALRVALQADGVGVVGTEPAEAAGRAGELQPDLILVDMAEGSPFELAQRLGQHPSARTIPIMALMPDVPGAEDGARWASRARAAAAGGELLHDEVIAACRKLERLLPERAGLIDPATRLYTERYFRHCVADEVERAWRLHRPFSLLALEADGLSAAAGPKTERLLREFADLLRRHTRVINPICRQGASTFMVILSETSKEGARFIGEKLRALVAETPFPGREFEAGPEAADRGAGRLTLSGGVASFFADAETAEGLTASALRALARARESGGNRIEGAEREDRDPHHAAGALATE